MSRIYFSNKSDCLEFFDETKKSLKIRSWLELAKFLKTSKSMIDNYKSSKLCLSEERFNVLLKTLPIDKQNYFFNLAEKKGDNWGRIIGGKEAYKINKREFDIGRKKGSKIRSRSVKYDFDINMPLSEELCEFVGVIIGDGFTNRYGRMCQTQIVGDKILDLKYYKEIFRPLCKKLFDLPYSLIILDNCLRVNFYSRRLFEMLTLRFGIPAGTKCYSVAIPEEILKAGCPFVNATLRGMFNTDGGVGLDKRKIYKKPYIRVNYTSASPKLIEQLHCLLLKFDVPHSVNKRNNTQLVQINGEENVKQFLKNIGFSNPRSLNKVRYLIS